MRLDGLRYALRAAVHRLGRAGGLGVALLAGAAAFHFSAVQPAQEELAALEARRSRAERPAPHALEAAASAADFERFMGFFPGLDSAPQWLGTIYAIAERERLELLQGSYRAADDAVLGLVRYRIQLPVRGGYPQIRRFVAGVLDQVPVASLDDIVLQREKVGESTVEAKITLSLHLQAAPKPASKAPALALGGS